MISQLEAHVNRRTSQILDAAGARGDCEFVGDVAYQLPMHVIADIVGIPEPDRPWVFARTDVLLRSLDPSTALTADDRFAAERDLFAYAEQLGRAKRDHPTDDIWSLLAAAEIADDDGARTELSELELDMFFVILTLAGSETTRNAISQGLMALVAHPDQLDALRADPRLLPTATDEMIRWASPVLLFGRSATRDVDLGGACIAAGDRVVLCLPRPVPFRRSPSAEPAPVVRRGRAALLPRGEPGQDGGARHVPQPPRPLRRRDHRRARVGGRRAGTQRRRVGGPPTRATHTAVGRSGLVQFHRSPSSVQSRSLCGA